MLSTRISAVTAIKATEMNDTITDMDTYLVSDSSELLSHLTPLENDLSILIQNVLDAYGDVDPLRILDKVKLHLLSHLPDDIPRFGPAIRSITEIFESLPAATAEIGERYASEASNLSGCGQVANEWSQGTAN